MDCAECQQWSLTNPASHWASALSFSTTRYILLYLVTSKLKLWDLSCLLTLWLLHFRGQHKGYDKWRCFVGACSYLTRLFTRGHKDSCISNFKVQPKFPGRVEATENWLRLKLHGIRAVNQLKLCFRQGWSLIIFGTGKKNGKQLLVIQSEFCLKRIDQFHEVSFTKVPSFCIVKSQNWRSEFLVHRITIIFSV